MKKIIRIATKIVATLTSLGVLVLSFSACSCEHEWKNADCENPKTCIKCNVTEGESLGHTWEEATCEKARTCSVCKKIEGDPLEHSLVSHAGKAATCTSKGYKEYVTCTNCSYSTYLAIPYKAHNYVRGKCTVCYTIDDEYQDEFDTLLDMFDESFGYAADGLPYLTLYIKTGYSSYFDTYGEYMVDGYYGFEDMITYINNHPDLNEFKADTQKIVNVLYKICNDRLSLSQRSDLHDDISTYSKKLLNRFQSVADELS